MVIIIEKQFDKIGDEYMQEEKVQADIRKCGNNIVIETEDKLFTIPVEVFNGIMK